MHNKNKVDDKVILRLSAHLNSYYQLNYLN